MMREWRRALVASTATASGDLHALARLAGSSLPATASVPVAEYLRRGPTPGGPAPMPFARLGTRPGLQPDPASDSRPSAVLSDPAADAQEGSGRGPGQRTWVLPAAQRSALRRLGRSSRSQAGQGGGSGSTAGEDAPPSRKRARQEAPRASAPDAAAAPTSAVSASQAAAPHAGTARMPFGPPPEETGAQACPRVCVRAGEGRGRGGGRKRAPAAGSLEHEPALHCYWLDTSGLLPNPALVAL